MLTVNQKSDQMSSAIARKEQWRAHLKIIRQNIPSQRRKEASILACEKLVFLTQRNGYILSFASFEPEIDIWPFNKFLAEKGCLVLPRIFEKELRLYLVQDMNQLETHAWGIKEPLPMHCTLVDLSEVNIALIPGLGFDSANKTRIGYGGGYYDRLLANKQPLETWGIGFCEQHVEKLPCEAFDTRLSNNYLF